MVYITFLHENMNEHECLCLYELKNDMKDNRLRIIVACLYGIDGLVCVWVYVCAHACLRINENKNEICCI